MFGCRYLKRACALAVAGSALAVAPAAHGAPLTTQYYTISIADPPPQSSLPNPQTRFLASINRQKGVPVWLQRYEPGVISQHWTPVYPKWPNRDLTGSSPIIEGIAEFFEDCGLRGCSFSNTVAPPPTIKFVNRYSARCMTVTTFSPRPGQTFPRLNQDSCAEGGDLMARQSWQVRQHNAALTVDSLVKLTQTRSGRTSCVTVPREPFLTANACAAPTPWWQTFRILRVAAVTCEEVRSRDGYCGLPPPSVVPRG